MNNYDTLLVYIYQSHLDSTVLIQDRENNRTISQQMNNALILDNVNYIPD